MKVVKWTDDVGRVMPALLRDDQPEELAPHSIQLMEIDVLELDWLEIGVEIHNELVAAGLYNYEEVQKQQSGVAGVVSKVVRRKIIELYRRA